VCDVQRRVTVKQQEIAIRVITPDPDARIRSVHSDPILSIDPEVKLTLAENDLLIIELADKPRRIVVQL
jgi:hypothetical protein